VLLRKDDKGQLAKKSGSFNSEVAMKACGLNSIHAQCSDGRVFSLEFLGKVGSRKGVDRI
jgi:hypothetical protein